LLPGLEEARPRTKHPDFVSVRPRSQPVRLPESPDPHRIGFEPDSACARSIGPGCTAVGRRCLRSSRTSSPVFLPAPRVTAKACIVRARSRVSGNAVHVLGRRGRVMRSDRRLHSEPIHFRASLCLVCSRRRNLPICTGGPSRTEACASCSPRAAFRRATPSRPRTRERSPKGSGPVDGSKAGGSRVSRRANRWVTRPKRVGIVRPFHALECERTLDASVASPGPRCDRSPIDNPLRRPPRPFPRASS